MTEIEALRKELNELRERIAVLEKRPQYVYPPGYFYPNPRPPFEVTCGDRTAARQTAHTEPPPLDEIWRYTTPPGSRPCSF